MLNIEFGNPTYNVLGRSNSYSKTSRYLFQYYRDKPALNNNGAIVDFVDNNTTGSFNVK